MNIDKALVQLEKERINLSSFVNCCNSDTFLYIAGLPDEEVFFGLKRFKSAYFDKEDSWSWDHFMIVRAVFGVNVLCGDRINNTQFFGFTYSDSVDGFKKFMVEKNDEILNNLLENQAFSD